MKYGPIHLVECRLELLENKNIALEKTVQIKKNIRLLFRENCHSNKSVTLAKTTSIEQKWGKQLNYESFSSELNPRYLKSSSPAVSLRLYALYSDRKIFSNKGQIRIVIRVSFFQNMPPLLVE